MHRLLTVLFCLGMALPALAADISGTISSNTTVNDGDTWDSGNVTIDAGVVLNVPAAATLHFVPAANRNLTGGGTLQIDATGRLLHNTDTSGDNLIVSGATTILNNGIFEFATGGDLQLQNGGSVFTNNGTLTKTGVDTTGTGTALSNDPSYIFPASPTSGGTFLNTGTISVLAGHLNIAGGSSTGGNFTSSGSGTLSFSGKWTELTAVADDSAGGVIRTSNESPAGTTGGRFTAAAATTTLNVTGTGLVLGTGNIDLNGNILQNDGLLRIASGQAPVIIDGVGGGSFVNSASGTVVFDNGSLTLTDAGLTNNGIITLDDGSTTSNDTVTLNGPNEITHAAGSTFNLNNGILELNTAVVNGGTMILAAGTGTNTKVTISGTTPLENGASGIFSLQTGTLTLNGNNVINKGTTNYDGAVGVSIDGTGRFINDGTFNHQVTSGNDNLVISGSATFENNGTFDFQDKGEIDLNGVNGVFENNGAIIKTVAGTDASYIFRSGTFNANDGSSVTSKVGTLHFGVNGTSHPNAMWIADGDNTETPILQVGGEWTGTIAGTAIEGGIVRISYSGNTTVTSDLSIGAAGLTLNFDPLGSGIDWQREAINTQGNTLTNMGLFTISSGNPATRTLSGGGEFVNAAAGTFIHSSGEITFADNSILRNQGTYELASGGSASGFSGAGQFINDLGATVTHTGGTLDVNTGGTFRNQGTYNYNGGFGFSGDGTILNDTTGTFVWIHDNAGTGTDSLALATGTTFQNDGTFTFTDVGNRQFTGDGQFTNNGSFINGITTDSGDNFIWNGAGQFINNGLFHFGDNGDYQMEGGTTFTNAATGTIRISSTNTGDPAQFFSFSTTTGTGSFDNQGTVEVLGGYFRVSSGVTNGTQFEDLTFAQDGGSGTLSGGTWIADSTATGTARMDLDNFGASSGITTIGQDAVVELTGSGATFDQLSSLATVHGGFYVNGTQNFNPPGFLNISSTGTVGGDGSFADTLTINGTVLPGTSRGADVGTLGFANDLVLNSGSSVTLGILAPTGTVNGSLDSTAMAAAILGLGDMDPTNAMHDAFEVGGSITLNPAMTFNVTDLGASFQSGQYFDLLDFTTLSGVTDGDLATLLNLPSAGALTWETSLFRSDGILFLSGAAIPEPSRALLLSLGFGLLVTRRRR